MAYNLVRRPLLLLDGRRVRGPWELHSPTRTSEAVCRLNLDGRDVYGTAHTTRRPSGRWVITMQTAEDQIAAGVRHSVQWRARL